MAVTLFKVWFKRHLPLLVRLGWEGAGEEMTFKGHLHPPIQQFPAGTSSVIETTLSSCPGFFLDQFAKQQFVLHFAFSLHNESRLH